MPRGAKASLLALAAVMLAARLRADETVLCNQFIVTVPFTITAPGHYCLARNITTSISAGTAITINASFVWLDLNNFILDGTPAGTAADTNGILAAGDRRNVTVRNGVVRGFLNGINLNGNGSNYTVENIWADANYVNGIAVRGLGGRHLVRNNVVTNTGGSTNPEFTSGAPNAAVGLAVTGDSNVLDNQVTHTFNNNTNGVALAFELDFEGEGQLAVNNRVIGAATIGFACGGAATSNVFLRDNIVTGTPLAYGPACVKIGATNFP